MRSGVLIGLVLGGAAWMLFLRGDSASAPEIPVVTPTASDPSSEVETASWDLVDAGSPLQHRATERTPEQAPSPSSVDAIIAREKPYWDVWSASSTERERQDRITKATRSLGLDDVDELIAYTHRVETTLAEQLVVAHVLLELRTIHRGHIGDLGERSRIRLLAFLAADGLTTDGARMIALPLAAWGSDADHQWILEFADSAETSALRWIALRSLGFAPSRRVALALVDRDERQALLSLRQQIESCGWAFTPRERAEVAANLENSLFTAVRPHSIDALQVLQQWSPNSFERAARRCMAAPGMDDRVVEEALRLQALHDPQSWLIQNELSQGNDRVRLAAAMAVQGDRHHPMRGLAQDALLDLAAHAQAPRTRRRAVLALSRNEQPEIDTALAAILSQDGDSTVRLGALQALASSSTPAAMVALEQALEDDPDASIRHLAGRHVQRRAGLPSSTER